MRTHLSFLVLVSAFCTFANARAASITNWHTFRGTTATTLSGQGTSSPIVGSGSVPASSSFLVGYMNPVSLTNLGDRITFSFDISFTDASGFSTAGDQLRFALFDLNGQTPVTADNTGTAGADGQTDNWRGYWFGHKGGGGAGANGSLRERPAALTATENPFSNTGTDPAPSLGPVAGTAVTLVASTDPEGGAVFSGTMSIESTPSGVALAGFLSGNDGTNIFLANDNVAHAFNYGAVAYLFGNAMSVDQVNLQNVEVTYTTSNALQITSQPVDVSVIAGEAAQFSVSWTGSGLIPSIQWRENGFDIFGATNSSYTIPVTISDQNGNTYSAVIQNVFGDSVTSSNATLTVIQDTNPPTVSSASSLISNSVNVIFSEPVDPTSAQDSSNYSLAGNTIASVLLNGTTNVLVTFDNPITTNFTLAVQNVKDISNNTLTTTNVPGIAHGFQDSIGIAIGDGIGFAFNDKIVVHASGADIFNTGDQFQYVYKPVSGDFDLAVRVESLLNTDANAKAGLMARVNTFFDSRNVMIEATPGRFIFQYRTNAAGGGSVAVGSPRPSTAFPDCWVRLVRSGAVLTAYSSTANGTWDLMGSYDTAIDAEGAYPADILVGLAVTSHDNLEITKAVFSEFGQAVVTPTLSLSNTGGNIELNWSSIGFNLQATPSLTSPITWTNIPNSSLTNRVVIPTSAGTSFYRLQQ